MQRHIDRVTTINRCRDNCVRSISGLFCIFSYNDLLYQYSSCVEERNCVEAGLCPETSTCSRSCVSYRDYSEARAWLLHGLGVQADMDVLRQGP